MKTNKKFLNTLYSIENIHKENNAEKITVRIAIDPLHEVFTGHFPGNPVLPGACTIQIIKELVESVTGKDLMLAGAGNIKYLSFINPEKNKILDIDLLLKEMDAGISDRGASFYFNLVFKTILTFVR